MEAFSRLTEGKYELALHPVRICSSRNRFCVRGAGADGIGLLLLL